MSEGPEEGNEGRLFEEEGKAYRLEERTFAFARAVRTFVRGLKCTLCNREDARQLVRSSGWIGANFIEATEAPTTKDYVYRLKISRKEAKESRFWLRLLHVEDASLETSRQTLVQEAQELVFIFTSIIHKSR